jgi:hypothetical protein
MPEPMVISVGRRRLSRLMVALVAVSLTVSCEYPNDAVNVENQSSETVVLVEELGDSRSQGHELGPGEGYSTRRECVDGDFIVESISGEELARRPGPFCQGDPPWIITNELLGTG